MNEDVIEVEAPTSKSPTTVQRPPDTARRPLTRGKDTISTAQPIKPTTSLNDRTADELRLLGRGKHESDPQAVPILTPKTRETTAMASVYGGHRPINTLVSLTGESQDPSLLRRQNFSSTSIIPKKRFIKTVYRTLETESIAGNNVIPDSTHLSGFEMIPERQPKRVKTTVAPESQEVYSVGDDTDESDELNYVPHSAITSKKTQGSLSNTSSAITQPPGLLVPVEIGGSQEYRGLESMMSSRNHGRRRKQNSREPQLRRPSAAFGEHVETMEICSPRSLHPEAHEEQPKYEGTARLGAKPRVKDGLRNGIVQRKPTAEQSRYFKPSAHPNSLQVSRDSFNNKSKTGFQKSESLQSQFVQATGKRRSSDVDISSDELAGDLPGDNYAGVKRITADNDLSHSRDSKAASPIKHDERSIETTGLAKSIIPTAIFKTSSRRYTRSKSPLIDRLQSVAFSARSIFINQGYHEGVSLIPITNSTDLQVVHQDINKVYDVRIRIQKLQKIQWSPSSLKVRLETSKMVNQDDKFDIELSNERDRSLLVTLLSEISGCGVIGHDDSEKMDRMFLRRRYEASEGATSTTAKLVNQPSDLYLMAKNKERRDEAQRNEMNLKRRCIEDIRMGGARKEGRIVDRLQANGIPGQRNKISDLQLGNSGDEHEDPISEAERFIQKKPGHLNMNQILGKVNPRPKNPHLLRSRSSQVSTKPWSVEHSPSLEDTFPEELRYSRMHSLGSLWKKPLVYPRDGKKKTTVEWKDLERLDEGQFLNDNLIGFYLRYLECKLVDSEPDLAAKVYWFNTYFFASLTQTVKGKRGINYDAVRKWTRSIDIFNYDYAIVPINESAHWYVAIICNLPALNRIPAASSEKSPGIETIEAPAIQKLDDNLESISTLSDEPKLESSNGLGKDDGISVEKPADQRTADSFAELSLDDIMGEDALSKNKSVSVTSGEHILEDQGSTRSKAYLKSFTLETQTISDIPDIGSPLLGTTSSQKKSKRRSNLPVRTWDPDQPTIITLDSLGLPHAPTIRVLKDYLHAEANDKRGGMRLEGGQIKGMTAKHIPLQDNFCDCGLFLLGYMDKFVEDPRDFIVKTLRNQYDEERDWPKLVANRMRADIRGLIQGLHADQQSERYQNASSRVDKTNKQSDRNKRGDQVEESKDVGVKATSNVSTTIEAAKPAEAVPPSPDEEALKTIHGKIGRLSGDNIDEEVPSKQQTSINGTEQHAIHELSTTEESLNTTELLTAVRELPKELPRTKEHPAKKGTSFVILDSQPESITDTATKVQKVEEPRFPDTSFETESTINPPQVTPGGQGEIPSSITSSPIRQYEVKEVTKIQTPEARTTIDLSDS